MENNLRALIEKIEKEIVELKDGMAKKDEEVIEEIAGFKKEIAGQKKQITKLEENNRGLKRKMERILFCIPNAKKFLIQRALPAELISEIFATLPLENAFGILTKMLNGLLARNVLKMFKSIELVIKSNKWNEADCGPNLTISKEELNVKHSGPTEWNCIRAILPIPQFILNAKKSYIAAYFEVRIVSMHSNCFDSIRIGFCTKQFPLEGKLLGNDENSIGIAKNRMRIDGQYKDFGNADGRHFNIGDIVGVGIIHSPANYPKKCFATLNGYLLGTIKLPVKFAHLQLFPALNLWKSPASISANFGQDKWRYPCQLHVSPPYAFKVIHGELITPVSFPSNAITGTDIPKSLKRIGNLPHGDVVCAVTFAKDGHRVFTGGKGTVKMWNIGERIGVANNSVDGDSSSANATVGNGMENINGAGPRAYSTEPWTHMKTYSCLMEKDSLKQCYVRSCKLFTDCSTLVVGGETNTICALDVERGEMKMELDCEAEACYALALSPDCRLCFSCCSSGAVGVWDLQSGQRIVSLEGHTDGASCCDLSVDGQRLWTGGLDNTVRCWDIGERKQMDKMTLDSQIFSLGYCPIDDWIVAGMEDQNVQVLNTNRLGEKFLLKKHQSSVLSLKFAHSGKATKVGHKDVFKVEMQLVFNKWFVSTGKDNVINGWRTPYGYHLVQSKEASPVLCCDISADDRFLLTGSGDKKASIYELTF